MTLKVRTTRTHEALLATSHEEPYGAQHPHHSDPGVIPTDRHRHPDGAHSVRIDENAKHFGAWDHPDVTTVRRAIRTWLRHFDCLTHHGHAVPLYWLHDWLMNGPCVGRRTPNPDAAWAAHLTLISALNQPSSGLSVVPKRSMVHV